MLSLRGAITQLEHSQPIHLASRSISEEWIRETSAFDASILGVRVAPDTAHGSVYTYATKSTGLTPTEEKLAVLFRLPVKPYIGSTVVQLINFS